MLTRPRLSWSDLRERTVGLWGLGVEGRANLRKLTQLGVSPVLVDDDPGRTDLLGPRVLATDDGGLSALARCDVVVKTPGISRYRSDVASLSSRGIPVVGGLGLWLEEVDRDRVVVITGTKGKSTTAAISGHLLAGLGRRCFVGGNLGLLPYDPDVSGDPDFWVIEVSSFQATDLASSPPIVGVTSLSPDHLDWHGDADTYFADKLSACTQPGARLTVADGDTGLLRARRHLLGPSVEWVHATDAKKETWVHALGLPGEHNVKNAMIARALVVALGVPGAGDDERVRAAAEGFHGLPSRLSTIGAVDGVTFVDDSLSTNVLPTLAALRAFPGRRIALIAGGFDRGIDYRPLAQGLARRRYPTRLFTLPPSGERIGAAVAREADHSVEAVECEDLNEATAAAFSWARPSGVVLLSPAAPSFGAFADYRARAAAFAEAMRNCGATNGPEEAPI